MEHRPGCSKKADLVNRIPLWPRSAGLARLAVVALTLFTAPAFAHRITSVSVVSHLRTAERTYRIEAIMEAVPGGEMSGNEEVSAEVAARAFADYLVVWFDRAAHQSDLVISRNELSDAETPIELRRLQLNATLTGPIPGDAREFLLHLDPRSPVTVVMLTLKDDQLSRRMQVLFPGETSSPVSVAPLLEGDPFAAGMEANPASDSPAKSDASSGRRFNLAEWRSLFLETLMLALLAFALIGYFMRRRLRRR